MQLEIGLPVFRIIQKLQDLDIQITEGKIYEHFAKKQGDSF